MVRKQAVILFLIVLTLLAVSCKKIEDVNKPAGPLVYESLKFTDAIPQEYGTLIGVTQSPTQPEWVGLWFQKQDGTIMLVAADWRTGKLGDRVMRISRK